MEDPVITVVLKPTAWRKYELPKNKKWTLPRVKDLGQLGWGWFGVKA